MRKSPAQGRDSGGKSSFPFVVFAEGEDEQTTARLQQSDLLVWISMTSAAVAGEPRQQVGPYPPGGFVVWGASSRDEYGAAGNTFPVVPAKVTDYGVVPLDEKGKTSAYLKAIPTKNFTPLGGKMTRGARGFVARGAKIGPIDNLYWMSTEGADLISHWHGQGANARSTHIHDVTHEGDAHPERHGGIDYLTVVAMSAILKEWVPVLNGGPDRDPFAPLGSGGGTVSLGGGGVRIGDSNSGGGRSLKFSGEFTVHGGFIKPVYEPADPNDDNIRTEGEDGSTTTTAPPKAEPAERKGSLRFIEAGPYEAVHVGHGSDMWMVDGEDCELHRYATTLVPNDYPFGLQGIVNFDRVHECSGHMRVGFREGVNRKIKGNKIKDAPEKHALDNWDGIPPIGRKMEAFHKHDPKDFHFHRGVRQKGLWKLEYQQAVAPVITPGPKIGDPGGGGTPDDPTNCLALPIPTQTGCVAPLPHPTSFGSTTLMSAQDCWPMDANVYSDPNWKIISDAPWVGGDYGWAEQEAQTGLFAQRGNAGKNPAIPGLKAPSIGGFLRLPAGVSPDCRGDATAYENPPGSTVFQREDIAHYNVFDSIGRPNPVTASSQNDTASAGVRDGVRYGQITGSAANRTFGHVAVDSNGLTGASATGVYRMEDQMRLSRGAKATVVIASGSITPANAYDHDVLPESPGPNDTLTTIDATNARDGDELRLWFPIGTQTVNETGNLLIAGTTWNAVAPDNITFRWDASASKWHEVARVDH